MSSFVSIGVDIGQSADPTALVVVESLRQVTVGEWALPSGQAFVPAADIRRRVTRSATHYTARHVERLPLGTPYPDVARRIVGLVGALRSRGIVRPQLLADQTGVGAPVVDLLREALAGTSCRLMGVTFTHGGKYTVSRSRQSASLGKAYLVSRLQSLLQTGRLKLPDTPESRALADELEHYEVRITEAGKDEYGAFQTGKHDDLATALGLACLDEPQAERRGLYTFDY